MREETVRARELEFSDMLADCIHAASEVAIFNVVTVACTAISVLIWMKIGSFIPEGLVRNIFTSYIPAFYAVSGTILCTIFNAKILFAELKRKKRKMKTRTAMIYNVGETPRDAQTLSVIPRR